MARLWADAADFELRPMPNRDALINRRVIPGRSTNPDTRRKHGFPGEHLRATCHLCPCWIGPHGPSQCFSSPERGWPSTLNAILRGLASNKEQPSPWTVYTKIGAQPLALFYEHPAFFLYIFLLICIFSTWPKGKSSHGLVLSVGFSRQMASCSLYELCL